MMHVDISGAGPDVVLLHGWGLHGGVWRELTRRLAVSFRVIVPDLPGHGRSRDTGPDFSLESVVEALRRQLAGPAVWIGWSLGALAALTAARQHPGAVTRLALIGATPRFVQAPDWPHAMAPETLAAFARELESDYRGTLLRFLSLQAVAGDAGRDSVRRLRAALAEGGEPAPAALRTGLRLLAGTDLRPALEYIATPTLVLHGSYDRLVPPPAGEYLAAHLPRAQFALIPMAGHAPFLSHARQAGDALEAFLHD